MKRNSYGIRHERWVKCPTLEIPRIPSILSIHTKKHSKYKKIIPHQITIKKINENTKKQLLIKKNKQPHGD